MFSLTCKNYCYTTTNSAIDSDMRAAMTMLRVKRRLTIAYGTDELCSSRFRACLDLIVFVNAAIDDVCFLASSCCSRSFLASCYAN